MARALVRRFHEAWERERERERERATATSTPSLVREEERRLMLRFGYRARFAIHKLAVEGFFGGRSL